MLPTPTTDGSQSSNYDKLHRTLDRIQHVRAANNLNWMTILRIAMTHAPEETKMALKRVTAADQEISKLVGVLTDDN